MREQGIPTILAMTLVLAISGCGQTADPRDAVPVRFSLTILTDPVVKGASWWYAAYTSDGGKLVEHGAVYDVGTGKLLTRVACPDGRGNNVVVYAISPDGSKIAFADDGGRGRRNTEHWYGISLADLSTGRIVKTIEIPEIAFGTMYFPSKTRIVAVSYDKTYVIDLELGKVTREFAHEAPARRFAVSHDGNLYAEIHTVLPRNELGEEKVDPSGFGHFIITIHELESGKETARLPETQGNADSLEWTPDGRYIVVSARPNMAIYDVRKQTALRLNLPGWQQPTIPPRMVADRFMLLIDEKNERNTFLDLTTGLAIPVTVPGEGKTLIVAIAPDGKNAVVQRYIPGGNPANVVYLARLVAEPAK